MVAMANDELGGSSSVGGLLSNVISALADAGIDPERLSQDDLVPLDHFHSRGKAATEELFAGFEIPRGGHVLDVGAGIGGPARFLAGKGYRVTAVELDAEFVHTARELTRRTMPEAPVEFVRASATSLPMRDDCFDGAWLQHVTMNIEAKDVFFAELARVVRPGGRLAAHEVLAGQGGAVAFPVPWAHDADSSFLVADDRFRAAMESAGWRVVGWRDDTPTTAEFIEGIASRLVTVPQLSLRLLLRDKFDACLINYSRALRDGRCRVVTVQAELSG